MWPMTRRTADQQAEDRLAAELTVMAKGLRQNAENLRIFTAPEVRAFVEPRLRKIARKANAASLADMDAASPESVANAEEILERSIKRSMAAAFPKEGKG